MEGILGIFSFSVEFTLEGETLKIFQASRITQKGSAKKKKKIWFVSSFGLLELGRNRISFLHRR